MSRILYLANLNPNKLGSMEEHALFLCRELKRRGDTCYLGFIAEPDHEMRKLFEDSGARIVIIEHDEESIRYNTRRKIAQSLSLRRLIIAEGIDLVHINFIRLTNPVLWGTYLTPARLVFTDHASGLVLNRSLVKKVLSKLLHFFLSHRIDRYIGVSDYVRDRLAITHHVFPPQVVTLYNGVNCERFTPADASVARAELGLPQDAAVLCSVAMLIPEKGIQHLIKAVAVLVKEQALDVLAVVVGEGQHRQALECLAQELGVADRVLFWGRRSDVHRIVAAADIVVVPPVWEESFGLIVAEAMASARPVVATRSGGIPELIEDRVTGMLVEKSDALGLAKAILELLSDDDFRQRLVDAAVVKVKREFDLVRQVQRLVDIYDDALEK